jgi:hypothetical protein
MKQGQPERRKSPMIVSLFLTALLVQDPDLTETTVDAFLRDEVARKRLELPFVDDLHGQTMTEIALSGRTVTQTWRSEAPMTPGVWSEIEQLTLMGCENRAITDVLELGVKVRNVYIDQSGATAVMEQDASSCEPGIFDLSRQWRIVRASPQITLAVDLSIVTADGPRRTFETLSIRQEPLEEDEAFRREIYEVDCEASTFARQKVELFDDSGWLFDFDDEPRPARAATPDSPMGRAIAGVCRSEWSDPTDHDLSGVVEAAVGTWGR